ncbi:MAG: 30S ribosomal protein S13 [Candidatus Pacebacteria bacterium]|nr:30S ribosomal protein S13 [Candidatus Paceibacterota bacterium]
MPRIAGVNLPENKQIEIALTYIYGIGRPLSQSILKQAKIDFNRKASDLDSEEIERLKIVIEKNFKIEGQLRRMVLTNIKRLKDIQSWRGSRHIAGLPVRGQTTRINSRTVRGNRRRTVGSGRKKAPGPK